jgi:LmbE family N-acetylglucosaminyl deacetylase
MKKLETIIQRIVQNKIPCFFVSPHLDDAILSAGDLINFLAPKTSVTVLTVFTEAADEPGTISAKAFVRQCNAISPAELFLQRRKEDQDACSKIGVTYKHLGFVDALWRKKHRLNIFSKALKNILPEASFTYPFYRFDVISGKIKSEDRPIYETIKKQIANLVFESQKNKEYFVFAPMGFGGHVDHVIVQWRGQSFSVILFSTKVLLHAYSHIREIQ